MEKIWHRLGSYLFFVISTVKTSLQCEKFRKIPNSKNAKAERRGYILLMFGGKLQSGWPLETENFNCQTQEHQKRKSEQRFHPSRLGFRQFLTCVGSGRKTIRTIVAKVAAGPGHLI